MLRVDAPVFAVHRLHGAARCDLIGPDPDPNRPSWRRYVVVPLRGGCVPRCGFTRPERPGKCPSGTSARRGHLIFDRWSAIVGRLCDVATFSQTGSGVVMASGEPICALGMTSHFFESRRVANGASQPALVKTSASSNAPLRSRRSPGPNRQISRRPTVVPGQLVRSQAKSRWAGCEWGWASAGPLGTSVGLAASTNCGCPNLSKRLPTAATVPFICCYCRK
jgi:hypothetical protein